MVWRYTTTQVGFLAELDVTHRLMTDCLQAATLVGRWTRQKRLLSGSGSAFAN